MVCPNSPVSGAGLAGGLGGRPGEVSPPTGLPGEPDGTGAEPARPGGRKAIVFIGAAASGGGGGGDFGEAPPGRPGDWNSIVFIGTSAAGTSAGGTAAGGTAAGGTAAGAPGRPPRPTPATIVFSTTSSGAGGRSSVLSADSRTNSVLPTRILAPGGSVVFSPALMMLSSTRVGLVAPSPSKTTNPEVTPILNCLRPTSSSSTVKSTLRDRPTIIGSPSGTHLGSWPGSRTSS